MASIASADISRRQDLEDDSPTEDCVIEHAKELRLDWGGEDGRQEFLMPLKFGRDRLRVYDRWAILRTRPGSTMDPVVVLPASSTTRT